MSKSRAQTPEFKVWQLKGQEFLVFLFVMALSIDLVDVIGRWWFPTSLSSFACSAIPLTRVAQLLVHQPLTDFASDSCSKQVLEPMTSIVFFAIKIALVLVGIIYYWVATLSHFQEAKTFQFNRLNKAGGVKNDLANTGASIVAFGIASFLEFSSYNKPPVHFRTDLLSKFNEDLSMVFLYFTLLSLTSTPVFYVLYYCMNCDDNGERT